MAKWPAAPFDEGPFGNRRRKIEAAKMSGLIGHTMYAILAAKAASARRLPLALVIHQNWSTYLAGAYLGCDIQTMPEAVCIQTGREVGYGTVPIEKSPLIGGPVRPFRLQFGAEQYRPNEIHAKFYGRSHLVFGWSSREKDLTLPWDHLVEYCGSAAEDALELFGPGRRPLAYVLGWMTHVVGDSLIKSIHPGVELHLLDGKYTPRNRPIQDLVTFHEIGRKELGLEWESTLADLVDTPVETIQLHYMRAAERRGRLGRYFPSGWIPEQEGLLRAVLAENRRYLRTWKDRELDALQLRDTPTGPECSEQMRQTTGGLTYAQMVSLADRSRFRRALWQIGEAIADLFGQVTEYARLVDDSPRLRRLPCDDGPTWESLRPRWQGAA